MKTKFELMESKDTNCPYLPNKKKLRYSDIIEKSSTGHSRQQQTSLVQNKNENKSGNTQHKQNIGHDYVQLIFRQQLH